MDYVILSTVNERFLIVFSCTFTPNQGSMSISDINPGKSASEVSLFVLGWHPTPVLLPEEFHGQWSLEGYSPSDHKRVGHDFYGYHPKN